MTAGIAGVDEAGRGALAGPVSAAAVVLDPAYEIAGLDDSKKLSAKRRGSLAEEIRSRALSWAIASASPLEIDEINILRASLLAMRRAVSLLSMQPASCLIDGNQLPQLSMPASAVIGGDALHPEIMAASILAKVARDANLLELHAQYPRYGFAQHKGYPTVAHLQALRAHGPCESHRRSYAPVAQTVLQFAP